MIRTTKPVKNFKPRTENGDRFATLHPLGSPADRTLGSCASVRPHQIFAGRFGEARQLIVLGLVEDFPLLGDFDHSRLAEGTAQEILEQALEPLGTFRLSQSSTVLYFNAALNVVSSFTGDVSLAAAWFDFAEPVRDSAVRSSFSSKRPLALVGKLVPSK